MGRFPSEVSLDGDMLKAGQQNVKLIAERVSQNYLGES